jgi:ABC-type branched-subunit amino acid transport system ATPase component
MRNEPGPRPRPGKTAPSAPGGASIPAGAAPPPSRVAMTPELEGRDLVKSFGGNRAVDGVSIHVQPGQLLGLIGPNGAGKSTLGGLLCGSLRPDSGQVLLRGKRIESMPPHSRARLGLARTFQSSSEFQRLTVMENLLVASPLRQEASWWRSIAGRRRWQRHEASMVVRARGLLEDFELTKHESSFAGELSGGQRRLVEIARALMGEPAVVVLDEPMAGLNQHMVGRVSEHLDRLRSNGLALVLIEHNVGVVSSLSDRIVVMSQGRVIAEGSSDEVLANEEVQATYVAG